MPVFLWTLTWTAPLKLPNGISFHQKGRRNKKAQWGKDKSRGKNFLGVEKWMTPGDTAELGEPRGRGEELEQQLPFKVHISRGMLKDFILFWSLKQFPSLTIQIIPPATQKANTGWVKHGSFAVGIDRIMTTKRTWQWTASSQTVGPGGSQGHSLYSPHLKPGPFPPHSWSVNLSYLVIKLPGSCPTLPKLIAVIMRKLWYFSYN